MEKKSFTLIEIIVSLVIVGIIVTFSTPAYFNLRRKGIDREAHDVLNLIREAEHAYRLEFEEYSNCPRGGQGCDAILTLTLPSNNWTYTVAPSGRDTFTATATGASGTQATWAIDETGDPY